MDIFFDDNEDDVLVRVTESTEYMSTGSLNFHDTCAQDEVVDVSEDVEILQNSGLLLDGDYFCSAMSFVSGIIGLGNILIYSCSPDMRLPGWIMSDGQHVPCKYNVTFDHSLTDIMSKLPNIQTLIRPVRIEPPPSPQPPMSDAPVEFSIIVYANKNNSV